MMAGIYKILLPSNRGTYAIVDVEKQVINTRSQILLYLFQDGVTIPLPDLPRFQNRIKIKQGEPGFLDAFLSVYFRDVLRPMGCKLVDGQGQLIARSGLGDALSKLHLS